MVDKDFINVSEDHELKNALKRNNKRETQANIETLKTQINLYKIGNSKKRVTQKEVNEIINQASLLFEEKK